MPCGRPSAAGTCPSVDFSLCGANLPSLFAPLDARRGGERQIRQVGGERDRGEDTDGDDDALGSASEHHDGRDGAGSREHRHAERHDADVLLLHALRLLRRRFLLLAAPRLHHVERVESDQDPARDLERADRDAEQPENQAAAQRECRQCDRARPGTAAGSVWPPFQDTTPMLAVTDGVPRNTVRMLLASRAAAALATVPSVSGISTANSSPPSRPTMSAWRTAERIASATRRSPASPVA